LKLEQRRQERDEERLLREQAAAAVALSGNNSMAPQDGKGWPSVALEKMSRSNSEGIHETNMETMVWNLLKDDKHQHLSSSPAASSSSATYSPCLLPPPGLTDSESEYMSSAHGSPVAQHNLFGADSATMVPYPSGEVLELMSRLCLERVLGRADGTARRTELGIALRDTLGTAYQKGWVNTALAELERKGHGRLSSDGVFFKAASPLMNAVANMRTHNRGTATGRPGSAACRGTGRALFSDAHAGSTSSRGRKRGFLLIDGGYYEWLQWHVLQGKASTHAIDVRLLVQSLENVLNVNFIRRLYVQSTKTGVRGSFHKMLEATAGFEVEIHRLQDLPATHPQRNTGIAMTDQILGSTFKAAFDALVVLAGAGSDVAPAFRMAQAENESRFRSRQQMQHVMALGGSRMSPDLLPYMYRPPADSLFMFENIMAACMVPKTELNRLSEHAISPHRSARSLSPPMARGSTADKKFENFSSSLFAPPVGDLRTSTRSVSESFIHAGEPRGFPLQDAQRLDIDPCHGAGVSDISFGLCLSNSSSSGSGSGGGSVGGNIGISLSGSGSGSGTVAGNSFPGEVNSTRPRRWCNFGHRCKYFEDVEANAVHFHRFAHVCPDDLLCPFIQNYAVHRLSEEGKAHFAMWKHSCPHGLECQYFAQPDKNRRHIEFFTHKAKVLNAAAAAVAHQQEHFSPGHVAYQQVGKEQMERQQPYGSQQCHDTHHRLVPKIPITSIVPMDASVTSGQSLLSQAQVYKTAFERESILSNFIGDCDPVLVNQMIQHQQQQHTEQQLASIPSSFLQQRYSPPTRPSWSSPSQLALDEKSDVDSEEAIFGRNWSPRGSPSH